MNNFACIYITLLSSLTRLTLHVAPGWLHSASILNQHHVLVLYVFVARRGDAYKLSHYDATTTLGNTENIL